MATLAQRLLDLVAALGSDVAHTERVYYYNPNKFPATQGWEIPRADDPYRVLNSVRYPDAPDPGTIPAVAARMTNNDEWRHYVP